MVLADRGPGVAAGQQAQERVADERSHRFVACEGQSVDHRLDLAIAQVVGVGLVSVDQLRSEVVAPTAALVRGEVAAVPPVRQHVLGDLDLLGRGGSTPGEGLAVTAPALERLVVGGGEADEAEDGLARKREREGGHELRGRARGDHGIDQLMASSAHVGLESSDPPVREALAGVAANPSVVRLGPVGHHGHRIEVLHGQDFSGLRRQGEHRILDVRRRERLVVAEHGLDVGHVSNHQAVEGGGVEHRVLGPQVRRDRVRIGQIVGVQRAPGSMQGTPGWRGRDLGSLLMVSVRAHW